MFVTEEDYRVVIGETALKVISQVSEENRTSAEAEAREEIAGYLRPKYDCEAVFNAEATTATGSSSCTPAISPCTT